MSQSSPDKPSESDPEPPHGEQSPSSPGEPQGDVGRQEPTAPPSETPQPSEPAPPSEPASSSDAPPEPAAQPQATPESAAPPPTVTPPPAMAPPGHAPPPGATQQLPAAPGATGTPVPPAAPTPAAPGPTSRPIGFVIAGIGMFAVGLAFLISAAISGFFQFRGDFSAHHALTYVMMLLNVLLGLLGFVAGGLTLAGSSIGRVLSIAVAGTAITYSCTTLSNSVTVMAMYGEDSAVWMQLFLIVLSMGTFMIAVASIVMLSTRTVNRWLAEAKW